VVFGFDSRGSGIEPEIFVGVADGSFVLNIGSIPKSSVFNSCPLRVHFAL